MEQYVIKGGNPLVGEVDIAGAKNAALAILSAAIMTDETILIENLPDVRDINVLLEAISEIGAQVERIDKSTVKINGSTIGNLSVDYEFIKKIRASYYLLGALLGKYKHAEVPLPGGCNIGSRPIDQHLKGFRALGADFRIQLQSYTVYGNDWQTIGYGMTALYGNPCIQLTALFVFRIHRVPADSSRINQQLGTFHSHQTCSFGIPMVPAHLYAQLSDRGLDRFEA